jgi:heat shock protein HtpX
MKRIVLFLLTNLAVMLVISVIVQLFGLNQWMSASGLNLGGLLVFSAVVGFSGAIISLLISKMVAKWSTGAVVINGSEGPEQRWLVDTVYQYADKAGIGRPEVAIYEGDPNAFATGAFKDSALVAVSTGLLRGMTKDELSAVLGHEVAHIANGDMVTLTLIQGVVNTFVVFFSRLVGYFVDRVILKNEKEVGVGFYIASFVCEIIFGILASMIVAWFSRQREFRADSGSAMLMGNVQPMVHALQRLQAMQAAGIACPSGLMALFSSHPPLEERIAALQAGRS